MTTETPKTLIGWVDHRRRPLVNLHFRPDRKFCAAIDTGFNGSLLWNGRSDDLSDFPGELTPVRRWIEVVGGTILTTIGKTSVRWFQEEDRYIEVEAFVAVSNETRRRGHPVFFVGTALLSGVSLFIDFTAQTVRIERSA